MILTTEPNQSPLVGELIPPGDKSISHRALMFASLAHGESLIEDLLIAEDVVATANACRQLGASIDISGRHTRVLGTGVQGLKTPAHALDMGNSGTAMRLLAGVLSAQSFDCELIGDESLSRRPMRRIVDPLALMGARIETSSRGTAPLRIHGNPGLHGIEYHLPVASAQIKSCLLLAGLYASGRTCVREPQKSRDHTERMLPIFGAHVEQPCCVSGGVKLIAADLKVPADISSAAFFLAAAAMVPDSDVVLRNVGLNPTRDGILRVLQAMGADIDIGNHRVYGAEPVGDIRVRYSRSIEGISIPEEWVPSLIDELPVIMAMAAVTPGTTRIRGATELRVKESDRLSVMAQGLAGLGVRLQEYEDGIDITGGAVQGGEADGVGDHRCAMSFGILGQVAEGPLLVRGARQIDTSYPAFAQHLRALGGSVEARAVSPSA